MKNIMTINAILKSISQQRFSTYQTAVFKGATNEECLGIYLWNKQLASAFLPALQILEVSLRNAIYQAKIEYEEECIEATFPKHEWDRKKSGIDRSWFITVMTNANNPESYRQIQTARKKINEENKPHSPENYIAKLTLGFWVALVDKGYSTPNATYLTLWPHLRAKVFPNAKSGKDKPLSINRIGSDLRDINKIRNRLSHHEPLWRTNNTYNVEQAINKIATDYKKCLDIIRWINPSNLKLLNIIDNTDKIRELCNTHALWKNKQLPNGIPTLPLLDADGWCGPLLMNDRLEGVITKINKAGQFAIIDCGSEGKQFFAHINNFSGGIAAYSSSDAVSFEPSSKITRGLPTASSIRRII